MSGPVAPIAYAHTVAGGEHLWERLDVHLDAVAERAAAFAGAFGSEEWGRVAGLWHDLGKYSGAFLAYLRADTGDEGHLETLPGRVDHSTCGAQHAATRLGEAGRLLAYCIAGHHAGLADRGPAEQAGTLEARLAKTDPVIASALRNAPAERLDLPAPPAPRLSLADGAGLSDAGFAYAFFCRMLFSCLVDADYLATEQFMDPVRAGGRPGEAPVRPPAERLRMAVDGMTARAGAERPGPVTEHRRGVLEDCRRRASDPPGFYSLTVPTGGGKTLSSLSFAIEHAAVHGLRRVVYAAPFTSIIEQNASVYRDALGEDAVLEHHSNLDPNRETASQRLTAENWDAPVVVTTTVQLFESLFANRPGACRKIHRIARTVIVLDEAQALPVTLLHPILAALTELVRNYGCTVVLCTATQPAVTRRQGFPIGLEVSPENEIIGDVPGLFAALKRTRVEHVGPLRDEEVAVRLMGAPSALCIVNTRRHAAALFERVRGSDSTALHLSASMCAAHRTEAIDEVRRRLKAGEPCRVVSTQVVEAGVDVDFPFVMRSMAGLDSIAQSAGRCNREGLRPVGRVEVFEADAASEGRLPAAIALGRDAAGQVLPDWRHDPLGPGAIEQYFQLHYWNQSHRWDASKVMDCFAIGPGTPPVLDLNFKTAAERFVMIDEFQRGIVVPHGDEGRRMVAALVRGDPPSREMWRRLQRYSVNVPERTLNQLVNNSIATETAAGVVVLSHPVAYAVDVGLRMDMTSLPPEALCV